jgi:hypothetical protein
MGDLGILLVQMRIAPDPGVADEIYALLAANTELPIVELMWGLPDCDGEPPRRLIRSV